RTIIRWEQVRRVRGNHCSSHGCTRNWSKRGECEGWTRSASWCVCWMLLDHVQHIQSQETRSNSSNQQQGKQDREQEALPRASAGLHLWQRKSDCTSLCKDFGSCRCSPSLRRNFRGGR